MDISEILSQKQKEVAMPLQGKEFIISADRNSYNEIYKKYNALALLARDKFKKIDKEFTDIEDLLMNAEDAFIVCIEDTLLEVIRDLISLDIYDIDKENILNKAIEGHYLSSFAKKFEIIKVIYAGIVGKLESEKKRREHRKQNRGRWQSATFGGTATDAWSNQLNSEMMNGVELIAHSVYNAIANEFSKSEANKQCVALFRQKETRENLINSVYDACFQLHALLIQLMESHLKLKVKGAVSQSEVSKARAMFNNLFSVTMEEDKRVRVIHEIFQLDPYVKEYYEGMIDRFGDQNRELEYLAQFFGFDMWKYKKTSAEELVKNSLGETEESAAKCKEGLEKLIVFLGIDVSSVKNAMDIVNHQITKLDQAFRTVEHHTYETREEAVLAREEKLKLEKIFLKINPPSIGETLDYEQKLLEIKDLMDKQFKTKIKEPYEQKVKRYLEKFDVEFRSVQGMKATKRVLFETRGEAVKARVVVAKLDAIFSDVRPPEASDQVAYEQLLFEKRDLIEKKFETKMKDPYLALIQQYLKEFDLQMHSVQQFPNGKVTIFNTREEAAEARKERDELDKVFQDVRPPKQDEQIAYELNLLEIRKTIATNFKSTFKDYYIQKIDQFLNDFHNEYRFINLKRFGIRMPMGSREEAIKAHEELIEIEKIFFDVFPPVNESLLDYEQKLLAKRHLIETKFQTQLKGYYLNLINQYLMDFDLKFRSINLFRSGTREEAAREKVVKLMKSFQIFTYEDLLRARQTVESFLPLVGLTWAHIPEHANTFHMIEQKLTQKICSRCNAIMVQTDRFCRNCGNNIL